MGAAAGERHIADRRMSPPAAEWSLPAPDGA